MVVEPSVVDDIVVVKHLWMWGLGERRRGGGGEEGRGRRGGEGQKGGGGKGGGEAPFNLHW